MIRKDERGQWSRRKSSGHLRIWNVGRRAGHCESFRLKYEQINKSSNQPNDGETKKMIVEKTKLDGVLLIKPTFFEDHRGEYLELYNEELYKSKGIDIDFVEDDISIATRGVIKGIHGDSETWKLISCLHGKFYLVVVNYDEQSKDYGKWQSFVLSEVNKHQVLVPPKHGNGHLCLSEKSIFHYKQSTYYDPSKQFTIRWDDPKFKIWWPIKNPVLSQRDEEGHYV